MRSAEGLVEVEEGGMGRGTREEVIYLITVERDYRSGA
jgi:hypothetical protein